MALFPGPLCVHRSSRKTCRRARSSVLIFLSSLHKSLASSKQAMKYALVAVLAATAAIASPTAQIEDFVVLKSAGTSAERYAFFQHANGTFNFDAARREAAHVQAKYARTAAIASSKVKRESVLLPLAGEATDCASLFVQVDDIALTRQGVQLPRLLTLCRFSSARRRRTSTSKSTREARTCGSLRCLSKDFLPTLTRPSPRHTVATANLLILSKSAGILATVPLTSLSRSDTALATREVHKPVTSFRLEACRPVNKHSVLDAVSQCRAGPLTIDAGAVNQVDSTFPNTLYNGLIGLRFRACHPRIPFRRYRLSTTRASSAVRFSART